MSDHSERGQAIRASVTIAWPDIRSPVGQDLDCARLANQIRYAWCALAPEMVRGPRFLRCVSSAGEVRILLCGRPMGFDYIKMWGSMARVWADFRGHVATSLVHMASLNMDMEFWNIFFSTRDTLIDMLDSPTVAPDPLEDAGEDET